MESVPDYYTILGVASSASVDEIRRAYRRLARTYHPDRNGGNPVYVERMKAINAARDLLIDPAQRAAYDARRTVRVQPTPAPPRPAYEAPPRSAEDTREQRRQQREAETAAWEQGTYRFGGQSPYTRRAAAQAFARNGSDGEFSPRPRAAAAWAGCLSAMIGFGLIVCLGVGAIFSARSVPDMSTEAPMVTPIPSPVPPSQPVNEELHPELCQAFLLYPGVLTAATDTDGMTMTVIMIPNTGLSDRIAVAMKIDATMDVRLHQNINDHVTQIQVKSFQGPEPPVVLLPGRESWGIRVPDQR